MVRKIGQLLLNGEGGGGGVVATTPQQSNFRAKMVGRI